MDSCNTDCIEKPLRLAFAMLGRCVARHSLWFAGIPIVISVILGSGFMNFKKTEANDIEEQFTPTSGRAKVERSFVRQHFPIDFAEFSVARLFTDGAFVSFVAVAKESNILTKKAFEEILELDKMVKNLKVTYNDTEYDFMTLCAKFAGSCYASPILSIINHKADLVESIVFEYPLHNNSFIGTAVGGVELDGFKVKKARAVRIEYHLREDDEKFEKLTRMWIQTFLNKISKSSDLKWIKISHFSSISRQDEFEGNAKIIIPLFSVTYFLTITFSIVSCMRLDCVRNKVWVATLGVLSTGLAVLTGFGLLVYCKVSFAINTANAPFLILGIGVDNMFIMLASWQKTNVDDGIEERMGIAYSDAATSITITTLTDILAFYIGIMTPFPSVQSFCVYTGTTVLLSFIYNITFFGAILVLNGKREAANRHWLTFRKVESEHLPGESKCYGMCCVGGAYNEETGAEIEHPISLFMNDRFGPFLTNRWTKGVVVVLYVGYLAGSFYGCFHLKEGIDIRNLANDYSYVIKFYDDEGKYFSKYGPRVMVSVTQPVNYWDSNIQNEIENCMQEFENLSYVDDDLSESWLRTYVGIANQMPNVSIKSKHEFIDTLDDFFNIIPTYKQDIDISVDKESIEASRFFIQTIYINNSTAEKNMLIKLRKLADECSIPLQVFHPAFIYYDQYLVIISSTVQNIGVAAGAMLLIAILMIPNPICSIWVTFAIASVLVGVAGFMTFWGVNLDSISMINLVICIGFSVDFTAHISYAFVSSEKETANERSIDALYRLGYPIIQGALSTIMGVITLSAAASYIFRTFFKIMFLVITFGAIHGVVLMPVFMTFFSRKPTE
ncbi:patched domain-containing protein 3-like [Pristis pectinata]|uniref:patched domain-containing protein 3-like n=1 Tax=Pristis pectinata TaxID=685728 RepID=UPI00223E3E78|nr:patched domain-containing protein 3-like [Pristis pectinata]